MEASASFLGKGWSFPPAFSFGGKELSMSSEIEDIQQSLEILFGTRIGERIMQEDFGSSLSDYQFEEISPAVLNRIERMIKEAVLYYEARIKLNAVDFNRDQEQAGILFIHLDFEVPESNSRYNMVYPFYLVEGN